ncbi:sensor histidine kinase [Roseivirga sp. 4D4]|uniref:sensor histidine kinase n=1 Tax=Roseivirga sp. 4D4 TaxID=1889784 RepID=UPI001112F20C|nr:histidine kinase [Roseivirga sp. 4D4]
MNKRTLSNIAAVILCWLLFVVIDLLKKGNILSMESIQVLRYIAGTSIWILLTFPLFRIFEKTSDLKLTKRALALILLGIAVGVFKNFVTWFVVFIVGVSSGSYSATWFSLQKFYSYITLFYYMEAIIITWVLLIIFYMLELYKNYQEKSLETAQLASQLANAQLESLRMQLQPHFLFNAHNTVSMLIRTKKYDQATEMISKISDLLRNSLKREERQLITLHQEIELIKNYLEIEEVRFEDHLKVDFRIDPNTLDYLVPNLLLQPLIENAFKHGISKNLDEAKLSIESTLDSDKLIMTVHNTGPNLPLDFKIEEVTGIGLNNVIERLNKLYGPDHSFEIKNSDSGVKVEIRLPLDT